MWESKLFYSKGLYDKQLLFFLKYILYKEERGYDRPSTREDQNHYEAWEQNWTTVIVPFNDLGNLHAPFEEMMELPLQIHKKNCVKGGEEERLFL